MSDDFSPSDMMAMMNANGWANGLFHIPFMYLIWLAIFGNGGFGNCGNWNNQGSAITRAELADDSNNQTVLKDLRTIDGNIGKGVTDISQSLCSEFNGVNRNINNGISALT